MNFVDALPYIVAFAAMLVFAIATGSFDDLIGAFVIFAIAFAIGTASWLVLALLVRVSQ